MRMRKTAFLAMMFFLLLSPAANAREYSGNFPIHWGFKRSVDEKPPEAGKELDKLLEKYGAVYKGCPGKKHIYLTFDNGYENGYTAKILDVLKKENVPAAFFVTGHYVKSEPELVKRMVKEGHTIGNHTWSHPDLTKAGDEQIKNELEKVRAITEKLTGQKQMLYLRPPRGIFSERTLKVAKEAGYVHVFWSLAFVDWHTDRQKGWKYAYDNIMGQIHPGAIILLHTVSKDNADALQKAIQDLKKKGYEFKSLDDLMIEKEGGIPLQF